MSQFLLAPAAKSDIFDIWEYYAVEVGDIDLADSMRDEIFEAIRKVARKPDLGHFRRDLASEPLRFWQVRRYLIIYRGESRLIQVVRILHGARDVQAVLNEI